ncbi:MAG: DUF1294 domain-containing protein [Treponema sp.]|nr:DUF1294 domain-containing protein [Treponema sp.]
MNSTVIKIILIYLLVMNLIGFLMMGIDKNKARKQAWRISEKALFLTSLIGGSLGTWIGMYVFHHKTKHWYFVVCMPLIFFLHVGLAGYLLWKFGIFPFK